MTAITAGRATAIPATATSAKAPVAGKGFLARAWAAFVAARMRQAEREIAFRIEENWVTWSLALEPTSAGTLLRQHRETVEPFAHVGGAAGQINACRRW